jgi:hypothetical protein
MMGGWIPWIFPGLDLLPMRLRPYFSIVGTGRGLSALGSRIICSIIRALAGLWPS